MRRRDFIVAGLGSPLLAFAQGKTWRIAMLDTATAELNKPNLDAFKKRLRELGYVERQNLFIEYRSADGRNERLPALATELISHNPDVIVVRGSPEIIAVKNATSTIPVVMSAVGDPVSLGVAASLSRPGGNITGLSSITTDLEAKRVQHLTETVPHLTRMASLGDLRNAAIRMQWDQVQTAANALGIEVLRFDVRNATDVVQAFETASKEGVQGVRIGLDSTTRVNRRLVVDLSARYKLPAIYAARRQFIALIGGAGGWPLAVRAQQPRSPHRIGVLNPESASLAPLPAFLEELRTLGWRDRENVLIDVRSAEGRYELVRQLADELVRSRPDVIYTLGPDATLAAAAATSPCQSLRSTWSLI